MPVYDYSCKKCGKIFDHFHKSKENLAEVKCPACGSVEFTKLFSAPMLKVSSVSDTSSCESCTETTVSGGCSSGMCGLE